MYTLVYTVFLPVHNRDHVMKIFLLFYAFLAKVTVCQDDGGGGAEGGGGDAPKKIGVGGGTSAAPFSDCFTTKCDANKFEMIIEVVKACPQFATYKGL